ncbi:hypothetical protein HHK36_017957 [Tetracentron sinense]|uniref:Uncharacterized protein n=1 Tax=Tetracentron sinense TaxID=13715 RepID=A0A834Z0M1_TETSI|nr:hypothetical protein HHK36_017957 [Tetracentron sinense]
MNPENWTLNALLLFLLFPFCTSNDTITTTQPLTDGEILVSKGENFALGFFSPGSSRDRYVGIWYNKVSEQTVVWVANRENPIKDSSTLLMINAYGNLVIVNKNQSNLLWSTNLTLSTNDSIAKLSNSGNLVLLEKNTKTVLWQSFDYPTHIYLPGMKLGVNRKTGQNWLLTSWKSANDPARGNYSYVLDPRGSPQFFLYRGSARYSRSGPWTGHGWSSIPAMILSYMFNYSFVNDQDGAYVTYSLFNGSIFSKLVLDESGSVQRRTWVDGNRRWDLLWSAPADRCDDYALCGPYGYCSGALECECLPGFEPKSDGSVGCVRKRGSRCGKGEGFLKLVRMKLPDTSMSRVDESLRPQDCQKQCLTNCSCTAYTTSADIGGSSRCVAWYGELMDIRDSRDEEQYLYLRVDAIELAANARKNSKGFLDKKKNLVILVLSIVVGLFLLVSCGCCLLKKKRETKVVMEHGHEMLFEDYPGANELEQIRPNLELPFFDLSILVAATDNFSSTNMLGKGGFGTVYKAWDLWNEERVLDLVDDSIVNSCPAHEVLRCIHVGFLCVQEIAKDRPTMPAIVFMLGNETTLPPPKQPAYLIRARNGAGLSATQTRKCSVDEVTMTMVVAR